MRRGEWDLTELRLRRSPVRMDSSLPSSEALATNGQPAPSLSSALDGQVVADTQMVSASPRAVNLPLNGVS